MSSFRTVLRKFTVSCVPWFLSICLLSSCILLPDVAGCGVANAQESTATPLPNASTAPVQQPQPETQPAAPLPSAGSKYDKAIFQKLIPSDQLTFLSQFAGVPAKDVITDKQFRKLMKTFVPDCMFHYGRDMSLADALDLVLKGSPQQVEVRDGRYFILSGQRGPYLAGRGFLWIDMQEGTGLGGFYFAPTNGEPTPSMNIFSRQVKEEFLGLSQLPPEFVDDFMRWSEGVSIRPVTTRYFLTGSNKKILLEHDEEFCSAGSGAAGPANTDCVVMEADAADLDMDAANYLEQTHHATNATAWMINGPEQVAWLQVRANTCGGANQLACRIRMTRERTAVITRRPVTHPHR